jgi:hypothetical protein
MSWKTCPYCLVRHERSRAVYCCTEHARAAARERARARGKGARNAARAAQHVGQAELKAHRWRRAAMGDSSAVQKIFEGKPPVRR